MSDTILNETKDVKITSDDSEDARKKLNWVTLFLGELRDGLTMINMQSAFLITSRSYTEKQAGVLFFVFGMSQFLFQAPAGYLMDYSDKKVLWLSLASIGTTLLTVGTAALAEEDGGNLRLMILIKFLQGGITALIPPGLNSITQGIVGATGMTKQVARNEMNNHFGTAVIVLVGSLLAFSLYPNIGPLFVVSPIACIGVVFFLMRIKPEHIDHNAARGLTAETELSAAYVPPEYSDVKEPKKKESVQTMPSFNFGLGTKNTKNNTSRGETLHAETPLQVLRDPILMLFTLICFFFHTANGCVLPLTMQSLALEGGRSGILMSGLCIILAQTVMVASAKICGDYSVGFGRKPLFLIGLFSVSIRCAILVFLSSVGAKNGSNIVLQLFTLSTQFIDGIGAGVFGTMYVLVTSDISGGTGRFSLTLGITTAAMSIGGTVSGYLGEMLAEDFGYRAAFGILGIMSLVPALLYLIFMPETLRDYTSETQKRIPTRSGKVNTMNPLPGIGEGDEGLRDAPPEGEIV